MTENLKVVVLGDGAVGKSCLLISYCTNSFPEDYVPTVFDNYTATQIIAGRHVSLGLWDTAGQEDYDRLRPLSYPETNVFLICFSLVDPTSLSNVLSKWVPELDEFCPGVPRILVGTKSDLVEDSQIIRELSERGEAPLTRGQIEQVRREGGFYVFAQTSAKTARGLSDLFEKVYEAGLSPENALPHGRKRGGLFGVFRRKRAGAGAGTGGRNRRRGGCGSASGDAAGDDLALAGYDDTQEEILYPPQPPAMPPAGKAPSVDILPSLFSQDIGKLIESELCSDVTLVFGGGGGGGEMITEIPAHKVILAVACTLFKRLFSGRKVPMGSGNVISSYVENSHDSSSSSVVTFNKNVKWDSFRHLLDYFYIAYFRHPEDLVRDQTELDELVILATRFGDRLVTEHIGTFRTNLQASVSNPQESEFAKAMNLSLAVFVMDQRAELFRTNYYNKSVLSDVSFNVEGEIIRLHKCLLCARSDYFSTMLHSGFIEGTSPVVPIEVGEGQGRDFAAFIQFLYTSHTHEFLNNENVLNILSLSHKFSNPRFITFCEVFVSKLVERECTSRIQKSDIDVIGLLLFANVFEADQLRAFALHFVASNYQCFRKRPEWKTLKREEELFRHVQENQWPPRSYLDQIRQYEVDVKEFNKKTGRKIALPKFSFDDYDSDIEEEEESGENLDDIPQLTIPTRTGAEGGDGQPPPKKKWWKFWGSRSRKRDVEDDVAAFVAAEGKEAEEQEVIEVNLYPDQPEPEPVVETRSSVLDIPTAVEMIQIERSGAPTSTPIDIVIEVPSELEMHAPESIDAVLGVRDDVSSPPILQDIPAVEIVNQDLSATAPTATPSMFGGSQMEPSVPTATPSVFGSSQQAHPPPQKVSTLVVETEKLRHFLESNSLSQYLGNFQEQEILLGDLSDVIEDEEALSQLIPKVFPRKRFVRAVREKMMLARRTVGSEVTRDGPEKWLLDPSSVELGRVIGSGSFGVVYGGVMRIGARSFLIAAKEIALARVGKDAILQEVAVMADLDVDNVLKCWGVWFDEEKAYVVTDFCKNGGLDVYLGIGTPTGPKEDVSLAERTDILLQTAKGMASLHAKGFVHRDLKPSNCLVDDQGGIKICDFGTSKRAVLANQTLAGTVGYIPPPDKKGGDSKKRDVYSFGIMCYEVLSGKLAYQDGLRSELQGDQRELLRRIHELGERPSLSDCDFGENQDLRDAMTGLVTKCWAQDSSDRPSFDEIVASLTHLSSWLEQ